MVSYHQIVKQLVRSGKYTMKGISEQYGIPYRTVQNWVHGVSKPPEYVERMIALLEFQRSTMDTTIEECLEQLASATKELQVAWSMVDNYEKGLDKAQELLHDKRFSEAIEIIDNL